MSNNSNPNINKFFNKLYVSFPDIVNIDISKEFGNVKYVYKTRDSSKWFVKYGNDDKEVFLFGKIKEDIPQSPLLTLTFDKISSYSNDCFGIINAKNVYINVEYFINNYPNFKTDLTETTIDVFINGHANSINVIKLGDYVDNIDILIDNLNILLNELDEFKPVEESEPDSVIENNDKTCEICGKKLKNDKFKLCKKCSKKRHAAKILMNLLKYVEPQTPFEKKDLNSVFKKNYEINDCIWSLEEFNLLTKNNHQYCLVNKSNLNNFIEKYGTVRETPLENEEKKEEPKKLNKECSICKKTLPNSKFYKSKKTDDGLEDYCKSCKKYVNAANYLKEILNQVSPGSEFKVSDLENNFKNPLEFIGRIWELQNFDLLSYDSDNDIYILEDLDTCQNFLDNYYIHGSISIEPETKKEDAVKEFTEEQQMDSVIDSIRNGKTDKEAAQIAGINLYKITHWFNEGKNKYGEEYIDFYNRYIEAKNEAKINSFKDFYVIQSFSNKPDLTIADTLRKQQMETVLKEVGSGSSLETAAFNSNIAYETLQYWYKRGKQNFGEEYNEFYEKINILQSPIDVPEPGEVIKNEILGNPAEETNDELNIPDLYKHILDPLPQKFRQIFHGAKESESGFAWVRKDRKNWRYDRQQKDKRQSITKPNIYELYCEVKKQGYVWGVRNLENARTTLKQCEIPDIDADNDEDIFKNILNPIAPEYNKRFKKPSATGFAWVKKKNNSWVYYNKNIGKHIENLNLYELYRDIKEKEFPWGVRDLEKAKESLAQCEKPGTTTENIVNTMGVEEDYLFEHILDPIPREYLKRFKKPNSSGIAWVKKISNDSWWYNNPKDNVRIYENNIYNLYLEVKKQNLPWGIRDLEKAKESLAQCEKPNVTNEISKKVNGFSSKITYATFTNDKIIKTIITGKINDNELIDIITNFKEFEKKLIRIITTRHSKFTELFMEFNLEKSDCDNFNKLINELNHDSINENKKNSVHNKNNKIEYSEEYLLEGKSKEIQQLYKKLKMSLQENYKNIEIVPQKLYESYKINNQYIASISPLSEFIKVWINSEKLEDYESKTRDVSNIGHWGVGNYEYIIKTEDDIDYFLELFRQSYEEKL